MSALVRETSPAGAELRAEVSSLLSIPGAERVLLATPGFPTREIGQPGISELPQAERWLPLLAGMAKRMSTDLGLGPPRVVVTIHAEHLVVLGLSAHTSVGLIGRDPGTAGLAIVHTRRWLEARESGEEKG